MGRALEVLLQGLGYDTRLIEESSAGNPEDLLEGVQLLLAAPTVSTESRERFLAGVASTPRTATIPVLTLSTALKKEPADQTGLVLWPCRMEDLKMEIEAALLTAGGAKEPTDQGSYVVPERLEPPTPPADSLSSTTELPVAQEGAAGSGFSPRASCKPDP